jgi:hypothetical protein
VVTMVAVAVVVVVVAAAAVVVVVVVAVLTPATAPVVTIQSPASRRLLGTSRQPAPAASVQPCSLPACVTCGLWCTSSATSTRVTACLAKVR